MDLPYEEDARMARTVLQVELRTVMDQINYNDKMPE